jgi:hypothetical protein
MAKQAKEVTFSFNEGKRYEHYDGAFKTTFKEGETYKYGKKVHCDNTGWNTKSYRFTILKINKASLKTTMTHGWDCVTEPITIRFQKGKGKLTNHAHFNYTDRWGNKRRDELPCFLWNVMDEKGNELVVAPPYTQEYQEEERERKMENLKYKFNITILQNWIRKMVKVTLVENLFKEISTHKQLAQLIQNNKEQLLKLAYKNEEVGNFFKQFSYKYNP